MIFRMYSVWGIQTREKYYQITRNIQLLFYNLKWYIFNFIQLNGGVMQRNLLSIMIGFKEHSYNFASKVKMMYRMIKNKSKWISIAMNCMER